MTKFWFHNAGARAVEAARALFLSNATEERVELLRIVSTYLLGINESGNQKGNLSYLAGTKKRSDSLIEPRRGSAGGRTTMTLLRERGRSDDNDARAFLLSNTAEERVELVWDRHGVDLISDALPFGQLWYGEPDAVHARNRLREVFQPLTRRRDSRLR